MAEENIFAEAQQEGNAVDIALGNIDEKSKAEKTASGSQPETNKTVKEPSQEGNNTLVVKKDEPPKESWRWMKMRKTNTELKTQVESLNKRLQDLEPKINQMQSQVQTERLPDWWARRYGETPESQQAYREYQDTTKQERDRIKEEVLNAIKSEQENNKTEEKNAKDSIDSQIEEMKAEDLEFETQELMKFIVDFQNKYGAGSLLDADGNYDLRKSLDLMKSLQPKVVDNSTEVKKKVASNAIRGKVVPTKAQGIPIVKMNSLRNGSWRDAE